MTPEERIKIGISREADNVVGALIIVVGAALGWAVIAWGLWELLT